MSASRSLKIFNLENSSFNRLTKAGYAFAEEPRNEVAEVTRNGRMIRNNSTSCPPVVADAAAVRRLGLHVAAYMSASER
jgi:hypothetical protein